MTYRATYKVVHEYDATDLEDAHVEADMALEELKERIGEFEIELEEVEYD